MKISRIVGMGLWSLVPLWVAAGEVGVGSPVSEFRAEYGEPEMEFGRNGDQVLYYFGEEVVVREGVVVQMPAELEKRIAGGRAERKAEAEAARVRQKQVVGRPAARSAGKPAGKFRPTVVSKGGAKVDLKSLMKPGRVTVVDFYADWCGPCRQLAPALESLAAGNPKVDLVKVDIVNWGTPVTKQYKITSVPNVRVYDGSGKLVGEPTHDLSAIRKNLAKATGR